MASQLELVGGMCEWAVFAAMHLEDASAREALVTELLSRHCEEWSASEEKQTFLRDRLQVPAR
jgi:hypothetical protein